MLIVIFFLTVFVLIINAELARFSFDGVNGVILSQSTPAGLFVTHSVGAVFATKQEKRGLRVLESVNSLVNNDTANHGLPCFSHNPPSHWSIAMWLFRRANDDAAPYCGVMYKRQVDSPFAGWRLRRSGGYIIWEVNAFDGTSIGAIRTDSSSIQKQKWYHIVLLYGTQIEMYRNGNPVTLSSSYFNYTYPTFNQLSFTSTDLFIGKDPDLGESSCDMIIDELRFYNYVLSPAQIAELYNNPTGPAPPTLSPSKSPSAQPTSAPTRSPTKQPVIGTPVPTSPTFQPSPFPTSFPTSFPSKFPTMRPTGYPTRFPSPVPSPLPSASPSTAPTISPGAPTPSPTPPTPMPTTLQPTFAPVSPSPTFSPSPLPSFPTDVPSSSPIVSSATTSAFTKSMTHSPTPAPTFSIANTTVSIGVGGENNDGGGDISGTVIIITSVLALVFCFCIMAVFCLLKRRSRSRRSSSSNFSSSASRRTDTGHSHRRASRRGGGASFRSGETASRRGGTAASRSRLPLPEANYGRVPDTQDSKLYVSVPSSSGGQKGGYNPVSEDRSAQNYNYGNFRESSGSAYSSLYLDASPNTTTVDRNNSYSDILADRAYANDPVARYDRVHF